MANESACFSFAFEEGAPEKPLLLIKTTTASKPTTGVRLRIDRVGLSANNKFYVAFGRNSSFQFFSTYPVDPDSAVVVGEASTSETLVHPPAWGLCTVVESAVEEIPVGTHYRAMLPIGNQVDLSQVKPEPNGDFSVVRPKTNAAYNQFAKVDANSVLLSEENPNKAQVALVCWPGIVTGFGIYHLLAQQNYYRGNDSDEVRVVVLTSASSKVSLATAFYMKQHNKDSNVTIVGYTSDSNKEFCEKTQLYDQVLGYSEALPSDSAIHVLVDVAGRGEMYKENSSKFVKAFLVGNSNDVPEAGSSFSQMGLVATVKMMLAFMGLSWGRFLNPKLELFLIMTVMGDLTKEWGEEGFNERFETAMRDFVDAAVDGKWMSSRPCDSVESIQQAFGDIIKGTVPPSQAIVLDVGKAVSQMN